MEALRARPLGALPTARRTAGPPIVPGLARSHAAARRRAPLPPRARPPPTGATAAAATATADAPPAPSPPGAAHSGTDAGPSPAPGPSDGAASSAPLDWYRQWYPLAAVDDLFADRPNALRVLDREVVAWRDGGGAWRVAADFCPHRLAPLSEGRVESREGGAKTLACPYHGWEFDGAGDCVRIPQLGALAGEPAPAGASGRDALRPALTSPKSCLTSYPASVEQGLLWVWAEPTTTPTEAARSPRCSLEDFRGEGAEARLEAASTTAGWFVRDLPASFEATLENG